jgi:hypothetical protein
MGIGVSKDVTVIATQKRAHPFPPLAPQVKVTPTFLIYRDGELIETITGTGSNRLLKALLSHLKEGERGLEWAAEATHTSISEGDDSDVENE